MVKLDVKIGRLKLKNPVMTASGTFGDEYGNLIDVKKFGGIVAKTITLKPRIGNPPPRVAETPSGMLNSIGLENKGMEDFIKNKLPKLAKFNIPVIASIAGDDRREFSLLAGRLGRISKIAAIELNLSCPNIKHGNREGLIAQDEKALYEIVSAARKATKATLITKLTPNITDIKKTAMAAEEAGSDGISLVNTFLGMAVDVNTKKPKLGNCTGGLSGPAIKPLALRMVYEAYKSIKIPIVGMGGIMNFEDAVEFILCGARAVQVGTGTFINPGAGIDIIEGLKKYLKKNNIEDVNYLTGKLGKI